MCGAKNPLFFISGEFRGGEAPSAQKTWKIKSFSSHTKQMSPPHPEES